MALLHIIIIITVLLALSPPPISQPIYLYRPAGIHDTRFTLSQTCFKQTGNPLPSGFLLLCVKLHMSWYPVYFRVM